MSTTTTTTTANRAANRWAAYAPALLSVLRIVAGLLLLQHGLQKMFGWPPSARPMPEFLTLLWFAGVIELVGGVLLIVGLLTRPTAFLVSGFMAFAYFIAHYPRGFVPLLNGGELAALYCFVFLYLAAAGPGPWSLDALRGKRAV